jgi:hypothetical protein
MHLTRWSRQLIILVATVGLLCGPIFAGVTASISGTVKDQSGAAIAGATVTATNLDTAIAQTQTTNNQGYYSFQSLPLGKYAVDFQQKGFRTLRRTDLVLDVNAALMVDASLQVGKTTEQVEVAADALHVETVSSQMGEVIQNKQMTDVPLETRSYTDLLGLQPGVISTPSGMTGAYAGAFTSAGFPAPLVSGSLDSGALSVNGMREAANGFLLNGMLVQETGFSGAAAIPNLDSLLEFRILTNNADAEYGNYAGGIINVVTKSGTNHYHGNVFEFLRNTDFDAANYTNFGQPRGAYHQNQFGGTVGGPIIRDKMFFFADYQGNRLVSPVTEIINGAPTTAMEGGDLSAIASSLTGTVVSSTGPGTWASQLSTQLGYPVTPGEPYYFAGCTSNTQCVLPNAQLAPTAFNPISSNMLKYILPANNSAGQYVNSSQAINLHDNKFSGRVDFNSGIGLLTAYYYFDRYNRTDPYWSGNAPLYPGFDVQGNGQTHDATLGATKTFGTSSVNEFRFGYFRLDTLFNQPSGGKGVTLESLGFASGANGAPGIFPVAPSLEGVPETDFNDYIIGVPSRPNGLIENIFQVADNFSKTFGTHTFKFGGQYHYDQLEEDLIDNVSNGNFFFGTNFNGGFSETGVDFVDFLLGAPSSYVQGQSYPSYGRNFYFGLFAQDSWRAKPNLTINYGLRYDVSSPFSEKYNQIQTIIPGEQSVVFPGSPTGWVFPGDPHVPSTLAPTRWNNFAPRLGLAYSFGDHEGTLGKLLGPSGSTSLRAGFGIFYTTFEGATNFNEIGDAPFGNYTGQAASTFAAPFTNRAAGTSITNLFPAPAPPLHFSASHPASGPPYDNLAEFFSAFGTIGSSPAFYNKNKLPYAEEYELSIQHQITGADLISFSYVGTQGHSLLSSKSANPGNPALCLATPGCGPGGENNIYLNGTSAVLATRTPLNGVTLPVGTSIGAPNCLQGSNGQACVLPNGQTAIVPFGNDSYFIAAGTSSYNSFQINYRHTSGRLQTLVGYTYSKSLDDSSGYGEQINPINPRLSRGLSAFDSTNNFVVSYNYLLPFDKLGGPKRLTNGWGISGITRFATGLPVTMVETDDQSLLGTAFGGPIPLAVDTPNLVGPLGITNPRTSATKLQYFSPAAFGPSALGEEGDARRRFFHGPGINNWDMALLKNTTLTESINLQFRAEFFNIWNHTQFLGPSGVTGFTGTGAATASSFGQVAGTAQPRIGQLSLKLNF